MRLSPEQSAKLQRLVEEELRAACRAAAADGVPAAALAADLDERRRTLESTLGVTGDLLDGGDHPGDDGRVGESG